MRTVHHAGLNAWWLAQRIWEVSNYILPLDPHIIEMSDQNWTKHKPINCKIGLTQIKRQHMNHRGCTTKYFYPCITMQELFKQVLYGLLPLYEWKIYLSIQVQLYVLRQILNFIFTFMCTTLYSLKLFSNIVSHT